jgi:hypothetical protein
MVLAGGWTMRSREYSWALILWCVLFGVTGCSQRLTLQQVESLLQEQYSDRLSTSHFTCGEGQAGWEYICQARYEPTALARWSSLPAPQKIGVRTYGHYKGKPQFSLNVLPDEGPVLSIEELSALGHKEEAEAIERSRRRLANAKLRAGISN